MMPMPRKLNTSATKWEPLSVTLHEDNGQMIATIDFEAGTAGNEVIESASRFIDYDEADMQWAEPLGLARRRIERFQIGDALQLGEFAGHEANMIVGMHRFRLDPSGIIVNRIVAFVDKSSQESLQIKG